jgi:hypothetical protein
MMMMLLWWAMSKTFSSLRPTGLASRGAVIIWERATVSKDFGSYHFLIITLYSLLFVFVFIFAVFLFYRRPSLDPSTRIQRTFLLFFSFGEVPPCCHHIKWILF